MLLCGLANAGEQITLSPGVGNSNQNQINDALKNAGESGTVILTSGEFEITGPIYISRDTTLKGELGAKITVSKDISSPWFSPTVGVVNCLDPVNVKINGIEIEGNCQNLPSSWASSPGHAHDQEQLIKIIGSSGNFGQNIEISNMVLHNSFGDGIQARFIDGIICSDNEIINTQHESIYYSACKNCKMINNKMAIITSDGGRFDNCINGEAEENIVWQYNGSDNNGAYKGGANGFQLGDAGSSKGYNGKKNWIHTENIEIHNNTIIDPGRDSIVIDMAGQKPSTNVYIHDNFFVNTEDVETMGISIPDDVSVDNPPSVEMSERIFESIFDVMYLDFVTQASSNDTLIFPEGVNNTPSKAPWTVEQHLNNGTPVTLVYGPTEGLTKVKYEVGGEEAIHTLMIGERKGFSVIYTNVSKWNGELTHQGNSLYLEGVVNTQDIKITCNTPKGSFEPSLTVVKIETPLSLFSPLLKWAFYVLLICFVYCVFVIKHTY